MAAGPRGGEWSLEPGMDLPDGMELSVTATLDHRFSSREASRYTALHVGINLGAEF